MYPGWAAAAVADRISDQVLKELLQLEFVDAYARKIRAGNLGACFVDRAFQVRKRLLKNVARFQIFFWLIFRGGYLRVRPEVRQ